MATRSSRLLLEIAMEAEAFSSDWGHCDRVATYVARMVSHNRTDSLLYSNLGVLGAQRAARDRVSCAPGAGDIACTVSRAGRVDRIELTIPCDAAVRDFYRQAVDALQRDDVAERYVDALLAEGALDPRIGLLELAVDYKARLSLGSPAAADVVGLVADLALEDA